MHLGDLGAEVIKVDPTARERGRDEPGYLAWNRNKRRLVLDLTSPADLGVAKSLVADADVAMFDAAPGVLESLGLDGVALTREHERLIHVWAPPYGETGRWSCAARVTQRSHRADRNLVGTSVVFRLARPPRRAAGLLRPGQLHGHRDRRGIVRTCSLGTRAARRGQRAARRRAGLAVNAVRARADSVWRAPLGGAPNYRLYQCVDGEWLFLGALFEVLYVRALEATGVLADVLSDPQFGGDLSAALVAPGAQVTMRKLEAAFRRGRARSGSQCSVRSTCRADRCAHARSGLPARPSPRTTCASNSNMRSSARWRCRASRSG